jgi:glucose/arabinose dehydrogenase
VRSRAAALGLLLAVTGALAALLAPAAGALTLPPGFADQAVVSGIPRPVALAFTPDSRLLVASQDGTLHVVSGGGLALLPALDLTDAVCSNSERGLLGIAVDPEFTSNGFLYVYYTHKKHGSCPTSGGQTPANRVSRFTMSGDTVARVSEQVLLDNIPSPAGNHNAGDIHFGKDGLLYVSVGDGGCDYAGDSGCQGANDAARDRHVLLGKILRVTRDGAVPAGNPFTGPGTAACGLAGGTSPGLVCRETFAWGLRNPFRFAFDPNTPGTRFFVNDVGESHWEEIDEGVAGADYGWNVREGPCARASYTACGPPPAGMTNPVFAYRHDTTGCRSLTGGAFVPHGAWPGT